ncbi:O-succinylbenzoate-CoA synthase [Mycobacterium sp. SMC-4]|uniref:O-succinylbenzoate-CoA synthase n=1 Tax=Mycobacterium sp. SMC-4 TaxID=2857059 RepID=UPI003CFDB197
MRALIDFDAAPVFAVPTATGVREGVLLDGPQGWGEFSPPPDADEVLAARWLTAAMEPSTVGWPDAVRGRVAVTDGTDRVVVEVTDVDDTVAQIAGLGDAVEFVELVGCSPDDAAAVRRRVEVPVAVDAALLTVERECADVAVLRCAPLGGVRRALRRAERLRLPCVVACTGTTSIGLAADVALAAVLPELAFACGPVPEWLRDADVVSPSRTLLPADGVLPAAPMPAAPDPARLSGFAVTDSATVNRWRDLLHRTAALL